MTKERVTISLDAELAWAVARYARSVGRPQSRVIAEMVRERLSGDAPGVAAATQSSLARRLNRMESRLARIEQDCRRMNECVLVFVRVWLEHNPPLDEDLADSLAASAKARFGRYVDLVLRGVAPGRSIAGPDFDLDILLSPPEAGADAAQGGPDAEQTEADPAEGDQAEEDRAEEDPTAQSRPDENLANGGPSAQVSSDARAVEDLASPVGADERQGREAEAPSDRSHADGSQAAAAQNVGAQNVGAQNVGGHEGARDFSMQAQGVRGAGLGEGAP